MTRAVLSTVARRGSTAEETTLMLCFGGQTPELARLSAAERKHIVDDFMAETFDGLDTADPDIRTRLRFGVPDLPDDPTTEQMDAWVELAELLGDADRSAVRERMVSASRAELARFRELLALVRGTEPLPTHREEFAWVVAALSARPAS